MDPFLWGRQEGVAGGLFCVPESIQEPSGIPSRLPAAVPTRFRGGSPPPLHPAFTNEASGLVVNPVDVG